MERPRLVPQLYGYAVCLVAVITILVATAGIVDGIFDAATPEMSRNVSGHLRTFESYREHRAERVVSRREESRFVDSAVLMPSEDALRRTYEDERRFEIAHARFQGIRKIIGSLIVLLLAAAIFTWHWRWLRRLNQAELA